MLNEFWISNVANPKPYYNISRIRKVWYINLSLPTKTHIWFLIPPKNKLFAESFPQKYKLSVEPFVLALSTNFGGTEMACRGRSLSTSGVSQQ